MTAQTFVFVLVCLLQRPMYANSDNLALLSGTLKMMQRAACDYETVSLACPQGTYIMVQVAQWNTSARRLNCLEDGVDKIEYEESADKCLWPTVMQYSLLQTVVEACQKKPKCQFSTQLKPGVVDPCPRVRKFVEVSYKCRPNEFRIQTECEDNTIHLRCNPHSRLAIFEAQFGRTAYEPLTCPEPQGLLNKTCMSQLTTEMVMKSCHGQRHCNVKASRHVFGTPCRIGTRNSLKIVYACVPLGVLSEKYETAVERDEVVDPEDWPNKQLFDDKEDADKWNESNVVPPAPALANPALQYPNEFHDAPSENSQEDIGKNKTLTGTNKTLYISIGVIAVILMLIVSIVVSIRYYFYLRSHQVPKENDLFTTDMPNVFNDAVSDVDNDIEVCHISGTFYEHPDMILYREHPESKGIIRAMRPLTTIYPCGSMYGVVNYDKEKEQKEGNDDGRVVVSPKTLNRYSDSQYFYG